MAAKKTTERSTPARARRATKTAKAVDTADVAASRVVDEGEDPGAVAAEIEDPAEAGAAVDKARARGAGRAATRELTEGARGTSAPAPTPASPADVEDADDQAVNHIHDDATRNTADLRSEALRAKKARGAE